MRKVFFALLFLSFLLIGCSSNNEKDSKYNILSEKEDQIYQDFTEDLDISKLKELEPLSIAKFYFQSGINKQYDVQYALYTDLEEYVYWSKEDDEEIPEEQRGTRDYLHTLCKNIDEGTFTETTDNTGYVEFISGEQADNSDKVDDSQAKLSFKMIKNEDGIWQVAFMPMQ